MTKVVWQYSERLPEETMEFLRGIAFDCCKTKNYVYEKYAGVKSLNSLIPVYNILNEMRYCGLRESLNLPAVYYELAIVDAVADIKRNWGMVKNKIGERITFNKNLSDEDRIYLRTVLKLNTIYTAILNHQKYDMPKNAVGLDINVAQLNNLLRRLTRRYLTQPKTERTDSFRISPNGYSYKDGAIRIVCRIPRKRIVLPLKDNRVFDRQIQVQIKQDFVALAVPVATRIRKHDDYTNTIYLYIGNKDMLTLSNGNVYGEQLDILVNPETERLTRKNQERRRMYTALEQNTKSGNQQKANHIESNNLGRLKYDKQKEKERRKTETFINAEINKMFRLEKPEKIIITKPVIKNRTKIYCRSVNRKLARSFRGYIRERLAYKCKLNSIELVEINSKGTGSTCSVCGAEGTRKGIEFICEKCGHKSTIALNSARNIQIKYMTKSNG